MHRTPALLLLTTMLLMPLASAGSHVGAGPAAVEVQDSRGADDCTAVGDVCAAHVSNLDDPQHADVDVVQDVRHVGVTVSGVPVSLDKDVDARASLPNPVFTLADGVWTPSPLAPGVPGVFEMAFRDQDGCVELQFNYVSLDKHSPILVNPDQPIYWRDLGLCFPDGEGQALGYHQIGPVNQLGATDTHAAFDGSEDVTCIGPLDSTTCREALSEAAAAWVAQTPNVEYGLGVGDFEVAFAP